ncbi:hypothetical protein ETSB_1584 [cyanobacterium endosymbiont of Epithemia turgida isolate EtSB Lake Yunoko]|nr:hypothetical protein ETSB_1584 [cyanobacterium endosymbiont of Epithemia turgida isolate EtSB Lake Yunoko]
MIKLLSCLAVNTIDIFLRHGIALQRKSSTGNYVSVKSIYFNIDGLMEYFYGIWEHSQGLNALLPRLYYIYSVNIFGVDLSTKETNFRFANALINNLRNLLFLVN